MLLMQLFRRKQGSLHNGRIGEPKQALLGKPREMPSEEKLDHLRTACARRSEVAAAFVTQRFVADPDEAPTLVLGLKLDHPYRAPEIFREIGDALHPLRPGDKALDFEILDEWPSAPWILVYERG
jgi:SseB protein C-terminal domain